jgi:tetratricopeptide (TPR) repeat protein
MSIHIVQGFDFYNQHKYLEAIEQLEKAGEDSTILCVLGCSYSQIKSYQKAEEIFHKALQLNPNEKIIKEQIHHGIAHCLYYTGKFVDALVQCDASLNLETSSDYNWARHTFLKGEILEKLGKPIGAWFAYRNAIAFYPYDDSFYTTAKEIFAHVDKQIENLL